MITVLLVDDDPAICRSIGRLLRLLKYRVLIANSGTEALALMQPICG